MSNPPTQSTTTTATIQSASSFRRRTGRRRRRSTFLTETSLVLARDALSGVFVAFGEDVVFIDVGVAFVGFDDEGVSFGAFWGFFYQ